MSGSHKTKYFSENVPGRGEESVVLACVGHRKIFGRDLARWDTFCFASLCDMRWFGCRIAIDVVWWVLTYDTCALLSNLNAKLPVMFGHGFRWRDETGAACLLV